MGGSYTKNVPKADYLPSPSYDGFSFGPSMRAAAILQRARDIPNPVATNLRPSYNNKDYLNEEKKTSSYLERRSQDYSPFKFFLDYVRKQNQELRNKVDMPKQVQVNSTISGLASIVNGIADKIKDAPQRIKERMYNAYDRYSFQSYFKGASPSRVYNAGVAKEEKKLPIYNIEGEARLAYDRKEIQDAVSIIAGFSRQQESKNMDMMLEKAA